MQAPNSARQMETFAAHPQAGAKRSLNPVTWDEGSDVVKPDPPPKPPKPRTPLLPIPANLSLLPLIRDA